MLRVVVRPFASLETNPFFVLSSHSTAEDKDSPEPDDRCKTGHELSFIPSARMGSEMTCRLARSKKRLKAVGLGDLNQQQTTNALPRSWPGPLTHTSRLAIFEFVDQARQLLGDNARARPESRPGRRNYRLASTWQPCSLWLEARGRRSACLDTHGRSKQAACELPCEKVKSI